MNHSDLPRWSILSSARTTRRSWSLAFAVVLALIAMSITSVVLAGNLSPRVVPQCEDSATSPSILSCTWVPGNVGSGGNYVEGTALPELTWVGGLNSEPATAHRYDWTVSWNNSYSHGYDWLVSWDQARQLHQDYLGVPLNINPCSFGNAAEQNACNALRSSPYSQTIEIPDDTFVTGNALRTYGTLPRIQAFEAKYGNRFAKIYASAPFTGTSVISFYHSLDNASFTPIVDGGDTAVSGGTVMRYTVYFTTSADAIMLEYAAHFAISGNPWVDPLAWGWDITNFGYGAGGIGGSSWHIKDHNMDNGLYNWGSQDNQAGLQSPTLYPISSNATWNPTTRRATDAITLSTSSNAAINGTMEYWVCGDTTVPYTDTLTYGCTSTTTATYVGSVAVTPSGKTAHATSPEFAPTVSGRYCFLTIFTPALNGNVRAFAPTADTNSTTECFMAFGPNAVTVSELTADTAGDGQPIAAILLSLLAVVAGVTVWKLKTRRRQSVP